MLDLQEGTTRCSQEQWDTLIAISDALERAPKPKEYLFVIPEGVTIDQWIDSGFAGTRRAWVDTEGKAHFEEKL